MQICDIANFAQIGLSSRAKDAYRMLVTDCFVRRTCCARGLLNKKFAPPTRCDKKTHVPSTCALIVAEFVEYNGTTLSVSEVQRE